MNNELKPKKKSTVPIFRLKDNLYIGGSGYASEVSDPTNCIEYLFQLMDGNYTVAHLYDLIQRKYPKVTYEELTNAIEQFDTAGFIENGAFEPEKLLDEYELARWARNINFLGSFANSQVNKYELQHRLKTARIALLGLGGLGSHLVYDLAAMGCYDIRAVEFDRVEISNLNRQILYNEADVGRLKAEVAAERIQAFSPRLKLDLVPMRLSSTEDVMQIIRDREYVFCVADRPKMKILEWVNEACVRQQAKLIVGGLDTQRALYWSVIPGTTGCAECWHHQTVQQDSISAGLIAEKRRLDIRGDNAAFVPLVSLVAGLMLAEFVRMVTGIAPPVAAGRLIEIHFDSMEMREAERWEKVADCPVCQVAKSQSSMTSTEAFKI
jgi:molybdopterin/thiamine biosynthesis adenylyltransferase